MWVHWLSSFYSWRNWSTERGWGICLRSQLIRNRQSPGHLVPLGAAASPMWGTQIIQSRSKLFGMEAHFRTGNERAEETLDMTSVSSHLPGNAFYNQTGQKCGGSLFWMKRRMSLGSLIVRSCVLWQWALEWRAVRWPFPAIGAAAWGWRHVTSFPLILQWKALI